MAADDYSKNTAKARPDAGGVASRFDFDSHGGGRALKAPEQRALAVAAHSTGNIFPESHSVLATTSPGGSSGVTQAYEGADGRGIVAVGVNAREATTQAGRAGFRGGGEGALLQSATHEMQHAAMMAQVMARKGAKTALELPFEQQDHDHATMMKDLNGDAPGDYAQALRASFNTLGTEADRGAFAAGVAGEVEKYTGDRDAASPLLGEGEKAHARDRAASFVDAAKPADQQTRAHPWMT